jgi:hypothetical protein
VVEKVLDRFTGVQTLTPELHFVLGFATGILCCAFITVLLLTFVWHKGLLQLGGAFGASPAPVSFTVHQSVNSHNPLGRCFSDYSPVDSGSAKLDLRHDGTRDGVSIRRLRRGGGALA